MQTKTLFCEDILTANKTISTFIYDNPNITIHTIIISHISTSIDSMKICTVITYN